MKRILFKAFAYVAIVTSLTAYTAKESSAQQAAEPAVSVDAGTIRDSTYINEYFSMRLMIPENWSVYDAQGDYAVFCVSTYTNEDDRRVMDKAIHSIRFRS